MILSKEELLNCNAGASKGIIIGVVGAVLSFLIGLADGYFRKLRCN